LQVLSRFAALGRYNQSTIMLQTDQLIQAAHRKASSELKNWSGTTGNFFQLTFFGDEGFRGVVILRAPSLDSALSLSYLLKLNPGGSVASAQLPSGLHEELLISHSKRLLNQREADDLQAKLVTSAQFHPNSKRSSPTNSFPRRSLETGFQNQSARFSHDLDVGHQLCPPALVNWSAIQTQPPLGFPVNLLRGPASPSRQN
jgi:hypothetical protein